MTTLHLYRNAVLANQLPIITCLCVFQKWTLALGIVISFSNSEGHKVTKGLIEKLLRCFLSLQPAYLMDYKMQLAFCGPLQHFLLEKRKHFVLQKVTSCSGDPVAHRNGDKHQITPVTDKNCLCLSHFTALATVLSNRTPFEKELNKTRYGVSNREKAITAFRQGMTSGQTISHLS